VEKELVDAALNSVEGWVVLAGGHCAVLSAEGGHLGLPPPLVVDPWQELFHSAHSRISSVAVGLIFFPCLVQKWVDKKYENKIKIN